MNNEMRVLDYLDEEEILAQMAEEAAEVAQAALKLRRARDGKNPTPVGVYNAYMNLVEEIGDVLNCIYAYLDDNEEEIGKFMNGVGIVIGDKRKRWIKRLKERDQV